MKYDIYKITCNINNRVYFGRSQEIEKRWRAHKNMLRRSMHPNIELQNDWSKYGEEYFTFEIIHTTDNLEESISIEQHYIDNDKYNKYNISNAINGGDTYSKNPRKEEIKKLKSKIFSGKGNPMYGKEKNEYTIKRIKEVNSKPVLIEGTYYQSITEASKDLGLGNTTISYRLNSNNFKEWNYV